MSTSGIIIGTKPRAALAAIAKALPQAFRLGPKRIANEMA